MALPNPNAKIIATGSFVSVFVTQDGQNRQLGLVNQASWNEDFNVTEANVIGFFGPVSIDAQNYRCQITIGTFIPANPRGEDSEPYLDGGEVTLSKVIKTRTDVALTGTATIFEQMDFLDKQSSNIIASFKFVVISSNSGQITPATYTTSNVQMMAIEKVR